MLSIKGCVSTKNNFRYMISIYLLLFIVTISSLITAIKYYAGKKRGGAYTSLKVFVVALLLFSFLLLMGGLPLFIGIENPDPIIFIEENLFLIIIFNLSVGLIVSSLIIFFYSFLLDDKDVIFLDPPLKRELKKGKIELGNIMLGERVGQKIYLSMKDLEKHMFICGATGTGKSNFLQNFLLHFTSIYDIPFFLVEFKGEYHFLQQKISNLVVLWPGINFSINIFNPGIIDVNIHAERIFDILRSGQFLDDSSEFSPQMEKVLVDILIEVCQDDKNQSWEGFEKYCNLYLRRNQNKIPMLSQTLISIKNRIRRFSKGPLKVLFHEKYQLNLQELFKRNVILDLSSIIRLGGEKEDAFFFLNMILKYLWDQNLTKGSFGYSGIVHLSIIEDAQYFAPQDLMKKSKITTYLEDIALLQRGTGECLITLATRPNISKEILANNGVVVTFKNHIEKDIIAELLNLEEEQRKFVSMLEEGQAIIRINSIKHPFIIKVPYIPRKSLKVSQIKQQNEKIFCLLDKKTNLKIIEDEEEDQGFKELHEVVKNLIEGN